MPTDSERLQAEGIEVVLKDGQTHRLKFDFRCNSMIEAAIGDLTLIVDRMNMKGQWIRNVQLGMEAALRHEKIPVEDVVDLLDFKKVRVYKKALLEAFTQGMPEAEPGDPKAAGSGADSPGSASTTSPQSASADPTSSSGA